MPEAAEEQLTWPAGQLVSDLTIAARSIGIDERALATELARGESIAQVARRNGVKPHRVVVALVSAVMADVAADIRRGDLTKRQIRRLVGFATLRAEAQVMSSHPQLGFRPLLLHPHGVVALRLRPAACSGGWAGVVHPPGLVVQEGFHRGGPDLW